MASLKETAKSTVNTALTFADNVMKASQPIAAGVNYGANAVASVALGVLNFVAPTKEEIEQANETCRLLNSMHPDY